jgi:hypothetical protein
MPGKNVGMTETDYLTGVEPRMAVTPTGILASTPGDHPYRIGVLGKTAEDARRLFDQALAAWRELHQRPGPSDQLAATRL